MGKVEDLRKMREAKYLRQRRVKVDPTLLLPGVLPPASGIGPELCGHKGVGGKSCTRMKNHKEKNHRYK